MANLLRGNIPLVFAVQVPPNGLVVYTGTVVTDDGKEKKLNIDFEPFKPINTSLYLCDNKFHTEALNELLESDSKCVAAPDMLQDNLCTHAWDPQCTSRLQKAKCVP